MCKVNHVGNWIKKCYQDYTDPSEIDRIMTKGFGIEIDEKIQEAKIDSNLMKRLLGHSLLMVIAMIRMISSYIYYDEPWSQIVLGNHFPAMELPKFIAISSIFVAVSTNIFIRALFAWNILTRNPELKFFMTPISIVSGTSTVSGTCKKPISTVSGTCEKPISTVSDTCKKPISVISGTCQELEKGMDDEMIEAMRKKLRPVICFMKVTSASSIPGTMFVFQIASFWLLSHPDESLLSFGSMVKLLWSIHYVVWMMTGFWMLHACTLVVIIHCQLPCLMMERVVKKESFVMERVVKKESFVMEKVVKKESFVMERVVKKESFVMEKVVKKESFCDGKSGEKGIFCRKEIGKKYCIFQRISFRINW